MKELTVIKEQDILGKDFKIYGNLDNPLFLAKDVANWIEYDETKVGQLLKNIDDDEKLTSPIYYSGQIRNMYFLTEDGLYEVLMQSRKPIAKQFKKQVKLVLKQIRQTGGYIPVEEDMSDMEILSRAVLISQKTIEKQKKQLEEQKPMVEFAKTISESSDSIEFSTFAKVVKDEKVFTKGRNKLFEWMRNNGYLRKNNEPYQKYMDMGLFQVKEYTYKTPYGEKIGIKTLLSGRGQIYFVEKLRKEMNNE